MKLIRNAGIFCLLVCLRAAMAQFQPDSLWCYKDINEIPDTELFYFNSYTCDTPSANATLGDTNYGGNFRCFTQVDTGDKIDGKYINFDYKFTDTNKGYAGFKIFWDMGLVRYDCTDYDSMSFWHKGPLPGHKVVMIWGQGGECGGPINYQYFGQYKSSATWKKEVMPFPPGFVKNGIFELRELIYDDSTVTTSPTSAKGCLKLDNMCFIKHKTGVLSRSYATPKGLSGPNYFTPAVSGKVTIAVYSLNGEQLFKRAVDVAAGKRYSVSQFTRNYSNLCSGRIQCIRITGSGVNITAKVL